MILLLLVFISCELDNKKKDDDIVKIDNPPQITEGVLCEEYSCANTLQSDMYVIHNKRVIEYRVDYTDIDKNYQDDITFDMEIKCIETNIEYDVLTSNDHSIYYSNMAIAYGTVFDPAKYVNGEWVFGLDIGTYKVKIKKCTQYHELCGNWYEMNMKVK
jgi:hypothetical protein